MIKRNIMFVDDDKDALLVTTLLLESARPGWKVAPFHDAEDALKHYEKHGADVVITDLYMPGMDGIQFMEAIRERDAGARIVAITGYAKKLWSLLPPGSAIGADRILEKPIAPEALVRTIEDLL